MIGNCYINETSKIMDRNVTIDFTENNSKTILKIGYIRIYLKNHFNWIQKKLWKLLLGIEIEDIRGDKHDNK